MKLETCRNQYRLDKSTGTCINCFYPALSHVVEARENDRYWKYDINPKPYRIMRIKRPKKEWRKYGKYRYEKLYRSYAWVKSNGGH